MRKLFSILIGSLFIVVFAIAPFVKADESAITNAEFADLLIRTLGLELPAGSEDLSDAEYYEVIANIFASRGLVYFANVNPNDPILAGNMAGVLYAIIGGTGDVSAEEIIRFLVDNGYLSPIDPDSTISLALATEVLNDPAFSDAIAEAYLPLGADRVGLEAPGFTLEDTTDTPGPAPTAPAVAPPPPVTEI